MAASLIAFDVFGTLLDTSGVVPHMTSTFGPEAHRAAQLWRDKQLEYTFRRALMRQYVDFDVCTAQALDYVSRSFGVELSAAARAEILSSYARLPAFADVKAGLEACSRQSYRMLALTNGTEASVRGLLQHAGLTAYFERILSADRIKTFKPDRAVYDLARQVAAPGAQVWLVSANPFDVIGAKACGLRTAWLQRDAARAFDPWDGFAPDVTVRDLLQLSLELAHLAVNG